LKGKLTVTLDEKSFVANENDVIFIHSGILHSGIPEDCVYQCIVFDVNNFFLKINSACAGYIQKILHQEIMIYHSLFTEASRYL
ncbi:MAG: AraC family ligand binding domain-containing protein, partial [Dorea sp.]